MKTLLHKPIKRKGFSAVLTASRNNESYGIGFFTDTSNGHYQFGICVMETKGRFLVIFEEYIGNTFVGKPTLASFLKFATGQYQRLEKDGYRFEERRLRDEVFIQN
jgi:hypothetical protein